MLSQLMYSWFFPAAQATHRRISDVLVQPLKCFRLGGSEKQVLVSWMRSGGMLRD
jgi:hypothetical protein